VGPEAPDNRFTILFWFVLTKVNNESSEIIRSLNSAFDEFLPEKYAKRDFYPEPLREKIDEINSWVYDLYNNGVYKVCPPVSELTLDRFRRCSGSLYVPNQGHH
jgi:glutathionyl-hydroquinone reductase